MRATTAGIVATILTALAIGIGLTSDAFGQRLTEAQHKAHREELLNTMSLEQADEFRRYWAAESSATTTIRGQQTPELVPYHLRMGFFFLMYAVEEGGRGLVRELKQQLSPADDAVLSAFAKGSADRVRQDETDGARFRANLRSRASRMTAVEIATAVRENFARFKADKTILYQGVIRQLSPQGQQLVNQWAFENIRPDYDETDLVAVAQAEPEMFKRQYLGGYQVQRGGVPP